MIDSSVLRVAASGSEPRRRSGSWAGPAFAGGSALPGGGQAGRAGVLAHAHAASQTSVFTAKTLAHPAG